MVRFDREITIIEKVIEDGDSNEDRITEWVARENNPRIWASKQELAGYEALIADRIAYVQPVKWTVRYEDARTVSVEQRLVFSTRVYAIQSVVEKERGRTIEIMSKLLDKEIFQ